VRESSFAGKYDYGTGETFIRRTGMIYMRRPRMTITLTPEEQQIVDEQLRLGRYRTPEDVVAGALRALRSADQHTGDPGAGGQEAVREMLRFAESNRTTLTGVSVKDLIHEGHRL